MSNKTFHSSTVAVTARPRSKRLREAGGWYAAASKGSVLITGRPSSDGGLSDLFKEVLDGNGNVIGIQSIYDLNIIQEAGDEALGTEDVLKNIAEILRLQERVNLGTVASPVYGVKVYGGLISEGDIVAYGAASGESSPTSYERLDPATFGVRAEDHVWPSYDSTKAGWILSAALGWNLNARVSAIENASPSLDDLSDVEIVAPANGQALVYNSTTRKWGPGNVTAGTISRITLTMPSGFSVNGSPLTADGELAVSFEQGYILPTTRQMSLFTPILTNDDVTGIQANFPMAVSGGIVATGDVVAYGSASGGNSPTAYDRLDPVSGAWPAKDNTKAGWILSSALGWDLNERLAAVENRTLSLNGLSDVSISNPTGGQALVYNATTQKWEPGTVSGGSGHTHDNKTVLDAITQAKVNSWDLVSGLFNAIQSGSPLAVTGITANYPMTVNGGIAASGDVVAYGSAAGGSSPTAYDRLDPVSGAWPAYDATKSGWVLSAALGWNLVSRIISLEQNGGGPSGGSSDHSHSNKTVLDGITAEKVTAWDGAATNSHTHSNKSVIDGITSTYVSHWNRAYSYSHSHSNQSILDTITSERVAAWDNGGGSGSGETGHSHSNLSVLNNISQTKFDHWDSAYSSSHSHSNKSVLDDISSTKTSHWDTAYSNSHTHSNKSVLDDITSTKTSHWDTAYTNNHSHSNKSVLDDISSTKTSRWDSAYSNSHSHSNKSTLDDISSTKLSHWDDAYSASHSHSNKTVLDGITSAKVTSWDNVAAGSWLSTGGGTLTGALAGTTLAFRTGTFGDASNAGSISIVRKIGNTTYTATVSIDTSGNIVITPTSTGIIKCSGTVRATGDVICYA